MAVLSGFQRRPFHVGTRARESVGVALAAVLRRLADSPLDSSVLQAVGGASGSGEGGGVRRSRGMSADWRTVTGPDGVGRLEARWEADQ
ncbi:hypothetical protein OG401_30445 [Kitasatospora purpeofusca]|uniref:hypothetical protein n=1 Tax=Kitasatospora purpeofusca TaxID=67352 RepID=UPI002251EDF0|nr:hypothetical protein [Kitasatospora purpeofusca]MCX4688567.1 hypothetical protein [Kitasatospora purpeofusca]